jgi:uncharacterized protein (TIGR02757 family)
VKEAALRERLERLYRLRNKPGNIGPDPLGFVRRWEDPADVEAAGVIAAALAYGRVAQIHATLSRVFERVGRPSRYLRQRAAAQVRGDFHGFRHRFNDGSDVAGLLLALRAARERHGSLLACFAIHDDPAAGTLLPALEGFVGELAAAADPCPEFLLARPERGSACKRWHLFLRWMVRRDAVDPGPWRRLGPERLVVPLDAHLFRIGTALGFTERRSADGRAALEVTGGFRALSPRDPVRYDFSLARAAMEGELADFGIPGSAGAGAGRASGAPRAPLRAPAGGGAQPQRRPAAAGPAGHGTGAKRGDPPRPP